MSILHKAVEEYIAVRRTLGMKLYGEKCPLGKRAWN